MLGNTKRGSSRTGSPVDKTRKKIRFGLELKSASLCHYFTNNASSSLHQQN
jgi:hypothetical protein